MKTFLLSSNAKKYLTAFLKSCLEEDYNPQAHIQIDLNPEVSYLKVTITEPIELLSSSEFP